MYAWKVPVPSFKKLREPAGLGKELDVKTDDDLDRLNGPSTDVLDIGVPFCIKRKYIIIITIIPNTIAPTV
jgi:hypothetical protein